MHRQSFAQLGTSNQDHGIAFCKKNTLDSKENGACNDEFFQEYQPQAAAIYATYIYSARLFVNGCFKLFFYERHCSKRVGA